MKLDHSKKISSDIEDLIQEIRTYFRDLDSKGNMEGETYEFRISRELIARIENSNGVVQTTLLTYLDKDAREEISDWEPVDQNRYYDASIREKVSSRISDMGTFSPKVWPKKKHVKLASGVVAAAGIGGIIHGIFSYPKLDSGVVVAGVGIVVAAAGMFFVLPQVVDKRNKKEVFEQLEAYLDEIAGKYKSQAQKIVDEYVSLFDEVRPEKQT